jgi:hypothetical protein
MKWIDFVKPHEALTNTNGEYRLTLLHLQFKRMVTVRACLYTICSNNLIMYLVYSEPKIK